MIQEDSSRKFDQERWKNCSIIKDRDPKCWLDVLELRRITVHCENDLCLVPGTISDDTDTQVLYARFYFKCVRRISLGEQDEAVLLYPVKSNLWKIPCLTCTDIKDTILVFPCEAGHVTCLNCFKDYCSVRLREHQFQFDDNRGYYTLFCLAGCPDSLIPKMHHFHLLIPAQAKWDEASRKTIQKSTKH